jgi:hypothetical protein
MPYKLRKAPKRDLYWVVSTETGKKHSKEPIQKDKAEAQMRLLYMKMDDVETIQEPKQTKSQQKKAKKFEEDADFELIKRTVLGVNCGRIDKELVSKMMNKKELIAYLRERKCPALIRLEAVLERTFE